MQSVSVEGDVRRLVSQRSLDVHKPPENDGFGAFWLAITITLVFLSAMITFTLASNLTQNAHGLSDHSATTNTPNNLYQTGSWSGNIVYSKITDYFGWTLFQETDSSHYLYEYSTLTGASSYWFNTLYGISVSESTATGVSYTNTNGPTFIALITVQIGNAQIQMAEFTHSYKANDLFWTYTAHYYAYLYANPVYNYVQGEYTYNSNEYNVGNTLVFEAPADFGMD